MPAKPQDLYKCDYCGTEFRSKSAAPSEPQPANPPPRRVRKSREALGGQWLLRWMWLPIVVLTCGPLLISALRSLSPAVDRTLPAVSMPSIPLPTAALNLPSLPQPMTRRLWDNVGGPPQRFAIKGREAVLGRMRLGSADELHIVAADSATAKVLWQIGPLGTYSDGYRHTLFQVVDDRVVISDFAGKLHIHDLESGREIQVLPLTDRISALCAGRKADEAAVGLIDQNRWALDVHSLRLSAAPLPAGCGLRPHERERERNVSRRHAPTLSGLRVTSTLHEGPLAVAAAVKAPGTALPYAVGFDANTRAVKWQVLLPSVDPALVRERIHDALFGGRYVALYGVGSSSGWHMVALDAASGARLWERPLRALFAIDRVESLLLSEGFIYLDRGHALEIYAAKDGTFIGTLGMQTYKERD